MNDSRRNMRRQILDGTAELLESVGAEAMSIRDVCQAAGVTAPTVYHHFGDKQGLLEAVADEGFARYFGTKRQVLSADPLDDIRHHWDNHVGFGLAHPAFYRLMYGTPNAEERGPAREAHGRLLERLEKLAAAGRLRLPPEQAATMIHSAKVGTTLILLSSPDGPGAKGLSGRMREAVFAAVLSDAEPPGEEPAVRELARTLLAALSARPAQELTFGERGILLELLQRLSL